MLAQFLLFATHIPPHNYQSEWVVLLLSFYRREISCQKIYVNLPKTSHNWDFSLKKKKTGRCSLRKRGVKKCGKYIHWNISQPSMITSYPLCQLICYRSLNEVSQASKDKYSRIMMICGNLKCWPYRRWE